MASGRALPTRLEDDRLDAAARRLLRSRETGFPDGYEDAPADAAVRRAWDVFGEIGATPELRALRRTALSEAARAERRGWRRHMYPGTRTRRIGLVLVALVAVGSGAAYVLSGAQPQVYETHVGERRTIVLADASRIALDEDSRVSVAYSDRVRDLQLLKGQAEFDLARNPVRPFSVLAQGWRVMAAGASFNLDLLDGQLLVAPLRGSVLVAEQAAERSRDRVIAVEPSERLLAERWNGAALKTKADPLDITAWKAGKLVFADEPLDRAVARVNRYARRRITLAAWENARAPISGVFDAGDSDGFARAVSAQLPIRTEVRTTGLTFVPG